MRWVAVLLMLPGLVACRGPLPPTQPVAVASPNAQTAGGPAAPQLRPVRATAAVADDADDPAVWVHPTDPSQSLIIGTNKAEAPRGALVVFGLDGQIVQTITPLDRPNNVDVEQGCQLGRRHLDLVVTAERKQSQLRIYAVDATTRRLREVTWTGHTGVFAGEPGERAACMGVALYKRPRDGAVFAVVSRKEGPAGRYLWQYRLGLAPDGRVGLTKVREFGSSAGGGSEIEAVAVDDELGRAYYADEDHALYEVAADPDAPDAATAPRAFGQVGFHGDREGLAIWRTGPRSGWLVASDQVTGGGPLRVYPRLSPSADAAAVIPTPADECDGLEVCAAALGPDFPQGILVMMNSGGRNFLLFSLADLRPHLPAAR
ncbi:MAG: phytase [Fimbriimonadaceae bacterium]|nr:phytase [Fimbriimonadaceae bacterium]